METINFTLKMYVCSFIQEHPVYKYAGYTFVMLKTRLKYSEL